MLTRYPDVPPAAEVARQGKCFLSCDFEGCTEEVEVTGIESYDVRGVTCYMADLPDDWASSDSENNAMAGAAAFCPTHAEYAPADPAPPGPAPAPGVDPPPPDPPVEPPPE